MDSRLLTLLPTEQARCREVARDFTAMGSIGCFAAALIEQALQRADRAIIDGGGEDAIRGALRELQGFDLTRPGTARPPAANQALPGSMRPGAAVLPVGRRPSRTALAAIN